MKNNAHVNYAELTLCVLVILMLLCLVVFPWSTLQKTIRKTSKSKYDFVVRAAFMPLPQTLPPESVFIRSFENRPLKHIRIHTDNLTDYASRHGYNYSFSTELPVFDIKLAPYWMKLQLAKQMLEEEPGAQVFMWIDSDALVMHKHIKIDSVLQLSPSSSIFIGRDFGFPTLNAGVFLIRNNATGRAFINDCLEHYMTNPQCKDENGNYALNGTWAGVCYEQGVMNRLFHKKYNNDVCVLDESTISNSITLKPNAWVSHVFGDKKRMFKQLSEALSSRETWLPVTRHPYVPVRACLVLFTPQHMSMSDKWRARLHLPVFVVDGNRDESYKQNSEQNSEQHLLEHLFRERPEVLGYDMIVKITSTYFVEDVDDVVARIPPDTDMMLQYRHTGSEQNTECIGMKPDIFSSVLKRVSLGQNFKRAVSEEVKQNKLFKVVRLPPITVSREDILNMNMPEPLTYL